MSSDWWFAAINTASTVAIAVLTFVLMKITRDQKDLGRLAVTATEVIERAYVNMSHAPPGLYCIKGMDTAAPEAVPLVAGLPVAVGVQITNHGHTPATIVAAVVVMYMGDKLPDEPPYTDHDTWGAFFLMPNEGRFVVTRMISTALTDEQLKLVHENKLTIWACGYVDYVDRFGATHRSGYARRYAPSVTQNNLVFETKPGYNYDVDRPLSERLQQELRATHL
jgi:hypothetical protein